MFACLLYPKSSDFCIIIRGASWTGHFLNILGMLYGPEDLYGFVLAVVFLFPFWSINIGLMVGFFYCVLVVDKYVSVVL